MDSCRFSCHITSSPTALPSGDAEGFMSLLADMLAGVPYSEKGSAEAHFQNACYILFSLMGQFVAIEDRTSDGRIDLTVETPHRIYIFELKADSTPEAAMEQIRNPTKPTTPQLPPQSRRRHPLKISEIDHREMSQVSMLRVAFVKLMPIFMT